MSDPDNLPEIRERRRELDGQIAPWARPYRADLDWLIGEVDRLRAEVDEAERLRGLLAHRSKPRRG